MTTRRAIGALWFLGMASSASLAACSKPDAAASDAALAGSAAPAASAAPSGSAAVGAGNEGADPRSPVLSPQDVGFKDTRKGFGWGDRCFTEYKEGKLGWAHAACDKGLSLPEVDAKARPPLLYNEGLIAKAAGDRAGARSYFAESLTLRGPDDPGRAAVENELRSVGGAPPPASLVLPADARLECRIKTGVTTTELFLRPATSVADAAGLLRTTAAGAPALRAVHTELYKGLRLVQPAESSDPANRLATVTYDPTKTMQVGSGRHDEPFVPCE